MKRQIVCKQCIEPAKEYGGEWAKRIYGKTKLGCYCDLCGKVIVPGDQIIAESIGTNRMQYIPWETEFLTADHNKRAINI